MQRLSIVLFIVGLLSACSLAAAPATPTPEGRSLSSPLHIIVAMSGAAHLSREGWKQDATVPLSFGTTVHTGDLIRTDGIAQVTIVCADMTVVSARPGVGGVPCPTNAVMLRYADRLIIAPRGSALSPTIPQIMSPRGSDLLDPHPLLRWREVPGVKQYTVRISGSTWQQEVSGATELRYPNDAPPLEPGRTYKLIVIAGEHSSDEERETGMGFTLLTDAQAAPIRQSAQAIQALGLDANATDLLLSNLYSSSNLYAEAIWLLEPLVARTNAPAPARLLGDLYAQVRLPDLATTNYQTALDHTPAGDDEGQALARLALGELALAAGHRDIAQAHLTAALERFTTLNDQSGMTRAEQAITRLQPTTPSP